MCFWSRWRRSAYTVHVPRKRHGRTLVVQGLLTREMSALTRSTNIAGHLLSHHNFVRSRVGTDTATKYGGFVFCGETRKCRRHGWAIAWTCLLTRTKQGYPQSGLGLQLLPNNAEYVCYDRGTPCFVCEWCHLTSSLPQPNIGSRGERQGCAPPTRILKAYV